MDSLKFADNTVQTTAMTSSYLTTFIQNVVNSMNLSNIVPIGTILAYGGEISAGCPDGYFWCIGGLTTISGSPNLFAVIGHRYSDGQYIYPDSYYLPDLRGAYLKGCAILICGKVKQHQLIILVQDNLIMLDHMHINIPIEVLIQKMLVLVE
jgi:hypothetical protein